MHFVKDQRKLLISVLTIALLALLTACTPSPSTPALTSPIAEDPATESGQVIYVRHDVEQQQDELWGVSLDSGNNSRLLTCQQCRMFGLASSPDGQRIAYTTIKSSEVGSGISTLHLINIDGTDNRVVVENAERLNRHAFSPDGTRLAFTRQQAGFVVDIESGDLRQLTESAAYASPPLWLDDETLVFSQQLTEDDQWQVHRLRLAAGAVPEDIAAGLLLELSPDATLMLVDVGGLSQSRTVQVVPVGDGAPRLQTTWIGPFLYSAWSPVGDTVALIGFSGDTEKLQLLHLEDDEVQTLRTFNSPETSPHGSLVWTPTGESLVYVAQDTPTQELRIQQITLQDEQEETLATIPPQPQPVTFVVVGR